MSLQYCLSLGLASKHHPTFNALFLGPTGTLAVGTPLCPCGIAHRRKPPMSLRYCVPYETPYVPTVLLTVWSTTGLGFRRARCFSLSASCQARVPG